jgi:hypothetical protein
MKIEEGLRPNDLRGMVRASVSVDQYESKIDETATVVAFMVSDINAANDLNRFIQKSYVKILDTEVSAAPNQEGYYLVFVELPTNDELANNVRDLCQDISALTEISKWVVEVRGHDKSQPTPKEDLGPLLSDRLTTNLDEFFNRSELDHVLVNEHEWTIGKEDTHLRFVLEDFGDLTQVLSRNSLYSQSIDESAQATFACSVFETILGIGWTARKLGEQYVVYHEESPEALLIRPIVSNV